jgi:acyl carrier protein
MITMAKERLIKCFVEALGISRETVTDGLAYNSIKQWDSIGHMALVAALESEFNVMFDTDEIIAMSSVAVAEQILRKHSVDVE